MSDQQRAEIVVDGNVTGLRRALLQAQQDLKETAARADAAAGGMRSTWGGLSAIFEGVQGRIAAIGAVMAGGAIFQEAVQTSAEFTEESIKLGRALGISASEASTYLAALEDIDVSQGEFVGAAKGLSKELASNESGLQAMGLRTRDAAGGLRPLNELTVEAIEILSEYREGTDRALAGAELFGKGFELTGNLIKLNSEAIDENRALQEELGSIVGEQSVADFVAFDAAGDRVNATLKALRLVVGNALIPVLTDLGNWASSIGPAAVTVLKGAFGGLVATFHLVTTGVTVLWETLNAMVVSVAEPIRLLFESLGRAMVGDLAGARAVWAGMGSTIGSAWSTAMDQMTTKAASTRERIWALFAKPEAMAAPEVKGKSAADLVKPETKKKATQEADPSYMQYYELALAEEKRLAGERNALHEWSKTDELAFWSSIQQYATNSAKDRVAIEKKVADLSAAVRKEAAQRTQALTEEQARHDTVMALSAIDAQQAAAEAALALGQTTHAAYLQQLMEFEQRRTDIQRAAMRERLMLLEADPSSNPVEYARIKNQIIEAEAAWGAKRTQLLGQQQLAEMQIWTSLTDRMSGLWDQGMQAMLNGTLTWRNGFRAIGSEVAAWFVSDVVGKPLKAWLAAEAQKLAIKLGLLGTEKAAQTAGSAATIATKSDEMTAVVSANAVEAGTGAAAAVAPTPFIGPALALAAMAAIFGAVMGMASKSAAGGYDIPRGLNPVVQTHAEEMILPAKYANVIRNMAASGSVGGQAPIAVTMNVTTPDADSFRASGDRITGDLKRRLDGLRRGT